MIKGAEIHTEEFEINGLTVKIYLMLNQETKLYTVFCKAFDVGGSMLWSTEILDKEGKPQAFHSLTQAVTKTRSIFQTYKTVAAAV